MNFIEACKLVLVAAGLMLGIAGCLFSAEALQAPADGDASPPLKTTFILIRHAERDPGLDPPLNAEGDLRAQALLQTLVDAGVTAIYCTDLLRNRQTVQPLADAVGLPLQLVNPLLYANTTTAAGQIVSDIFAAHAGGTILFCGNIGSTFGTPGITEEIYRELGGTGTGPNRYQDMFIVVAPDIGPAGFIKAEYGGASSLDF